jgi:hypothetical protein
VRRRGRSNRPPPKRGRDAAPTSRFSWRTQSDRLLGNLSGFVFNYLIGWIQAETGSFPLALMPIAAVAAIGTVCVLVIGRHQPRTVAATT